MIWHTIWAINIPNFPLCSLPRKVQLILCHAWMNINNYECDVCIVFWIEFDGFSGAGIWGWSSWHLQRKKKKNKNKKENLIIGEFIWSMGISSDNVHGFVLAVSSSIFIGSSFIIKKKGLKKAGTTGTRAGEFHFILYPHNLFDQLINIWLLNWCS